MLGKFDRHWGGVDIRLARQSFQPIKRETRGSVNGGDSKTVAKIRRILNWKGEYKRDGKSE